MQLQQRAMEVDARANDVAAHHPVKPGLKKSNTRSGRTFGQDLTNQSRAGGSANQQRGKPAKAGSGKGKASSQADEDLVQKPQLTAVVDEDADVVVKDRALAAEDEELQFDSDDEHMVIEELPEHLREWDQKTLDDDLHMTDYIHDIMTSLKEQESREDISLADNDFMKFQDDINANMRTVLVDWLVEVHRKFKLVPATYFLAINILDRFLSKTQIGRKKLQLCGCACLWISSKYHEIYSPEMDDFVYISDRAFTGEDIIAMEVEILKSVNFVLTVPTVLHYATRYARISAHYLKKPREMKIIAHLIMYCTEHCVVHYKLCRRPPSLLGAACFAFACISTKVFTVTRFERDDLAEVCGYDMDALRPTMRLINDVVRSVAGKKSNFSVFKKYCHAKYSSIAKLNFKKLKTDFLDDLEEPEINPKGFNLTPIKKQLRSRHLARRRRNE